MPEGEKVLREGSGRKRGGVIAREHFQEKVGWAEEREAGDALKF